MGEDKLAKQSSSAPVVRPTLEALSQDVATRRGAYRAAINSATGPSGREKSQHLYATAGLTPFMTLAEQWLQVQREKLLYDDASGILQAERDLRRQDLVNAAERRIESLQTSMTRATWVIAAFTVLAAVAALGALLIAVLK